MFQAPIPGQSLTDSPRNAPWERPPEIVDPEDAAAYHIDHLSEEDVVDDVLFVLEYGMPVKALTESVLRSGVMKGIHTVDVSLTIAPVVHEYITTLAKDAGIPFKEDFDRSKEKEDKVMTKALALLDKTANKIPEKKRDAGYDYLKDVSKTAAKKDPAQMELDLKGATPRKGILSKEAV